MFERYMGAKQDKPNKWVSITITVSFIAHLMGGTALLIYSFWKIEKLPVKDTSVLYMAAQMATPPPPPPPPPPPKKSSVKKTETKQKPTELVQPDKEQKKPEAEESSEDEGVEGGQEGGVAGGVVGGEVGGELGGTLGGVLGGSGPATPPPAAPAVVAQQMLEGQRIAGNAKIQLSDSQTVMLDNQGVRKLQVKTKMCLDAGGAAKSVSFTKSSGYPDIDQRIQAEMMKWRYRAYVVNGKAIDVCFIVIFNYSIS